MDVEVPLGAGRLSGTLTLPSRAARGALVLLHGLASTRHEFADAGERLAAKGWITLAVDSRAHGRAAALDGTARPELAVEDVAAAAQFLVAEKHWTGPLGLVGHSMGAALACLALPRLAQFRAAALVAPSDSVEGEIGALEMAGYKVGNAANVAATKLGLKPLRVPYKLRYEDLYADAEAAARARKAGFLATHVSLANYAALMSVQGARWARDVKVPTLVVVCRQDKAVQAASSRRVHDALAGPKRLVEIESGHSAFGDLRAEELSGLLDAWFREALQA